MSAPGCQNQIVDHNSSELTIIMATPIIHPQFAASETKNRVKVYPERIQRVRAKKPKSRTGCRTCKLRRVKCDEQKPFCQRCQKFGVDCDYAKPPSRSYPKTILPRTEIPHAIQSVNSLFQDEEEYQYFTYYRDSVSLDLAGLMPSEIWSYVVLRACNEDLSLRHLTVSLAALSKANIPHGLSASHRCFAHKQYDKALRGIRNIVATRSDPESVRVVLIASLLIYSFECLQGSISTALVYAETALTLFQKRLPPSSRQYSKIRSITPIPWLEPELVAIYVKLDNSLMSRVPGPSSLSRQFILNMKYIDEPYSPPREFKDLHEASNYLEHIQYVAMPILAFTADAMIGGTVLNTRPPPQRYTELLAQVQTWVDAFDPLLERASSPAFEHEFIPAAALKTLALCTNLGARTVCLGRDSMIFENELKEILQLCRQAVRHRLFKKTFVFNCGIVPSLFVILMLGKEWDMREEALKILREAGGRVELCWVAADVAELGEKTLMAEERLRNLGI